MFPLPNGEMVVRERAGLIRDPYSGKDVRSDWTNAETIELVGVAIAPSSTVEPVNASRSQVITQMSIYCGPGEDVLPMDRIRARTGLWEVVGEIQDWTNGFTGWNPGAEFAIRKVAG